MKSVVMLILGLVIGAFGAVTALSALQQTTPLSHGVMSVSLHHFGALRKALENNRCVVTDTLPRLARMRSTVDDFEAALIPSGGDDAALARHVGTYRAALDTAVASAPADCAALKPAIAEIGAACKACHLEFKG